jgi:hypothetical protein
VDIADEMGLTLALVHQRIASMRAAWEVRNTCQLVAEAYHRGVLKARVRS